MPTIKKIIKNEAGCRPVIVDFQNGKIKPSEGDKVESSLYDVGEGKTIVGVTNGNMLYTGEIENENELYNNFIMVHNKATGKVRLIQVDCCTVSPVLTKRNNIMDVSMATAVSSVSELSKQFGSKKSKRTTEQRERLMMNIDTVKEQLEKTVSGITVDETDVSFTTPNENDSLYRPKINRNASTIDQVYDIEGIVSKSVLNSLAQDAQIIAKGADFSEYSLTSFASTNIQEILASSPDELKIFRISVFLYINYLIKFMNTPVKNITKKFVLCEKSQEVNQHILDNYSITSGHNRTRPLSMKDKALCSILVLSALAMDYQINVETLSKDFKTGIKKILEIARVLAFTLSYKNKTVITLKLPLPEPVSMSLKRKKK